MGAVTLSDDQVTILGRPCFACARVAHILIAAGVYEDKAKKAEYEQDVFVHWASDLLDKHGSDWPNVAEKALRLMHTQTKCDHDWEIFESDGYKQCSYPECQLERELTAQDYEDIEANSQSFELQQFLEER